MMLHFDVDLVGLALESKESGWQAQLHASAKFAASEEDDTDCIRETLTRALLSDDTDDRPWVIRGRNFEIRLCVRFDGWLGADERDLFAERLTVHVRTAKVTQNVLFLVESANSYELWEQLHLVPTAIEVLNAGGPTQTFRIFLEHSENCRGEGRQKTHKLHVDVPFHDIRPPQGIPTASLEIWHMDMALENTSLRKRTRLARTESHPQYSRRREANLSDNQQEPMLDTGSWADTEGTEEPASCPDDVIGTSPDMLEWLSDDDDFGDTTMLLDLNNEHDNVSTLLSSVVSQVRKRRSSLPDLGTDVKPPNLDAALELVDATIRMSIIDAPRHLPKGVRSTAGASFRHMAPLAPSLWVPAYLPNVASRAPFIPTLSHALATVYNSSIVPIAHKRKQSTSVGDFQPMSWPAADSGAISDHVIATDGFSRQLWRLLARSMYDPVAARRLAPLSIARKDVHAASEEDYEMLDSSQEGAWRNLMKREDVTSLGNFHCEDEMLLDEQLLEEDETSEIDWFDEEDLFSTCKSCTPLDSMIDPLGM